MMVMFQVTMLISYELKKGVTIEEVQTGETGREELIWFHLLDVILVAGMSGVGQVLEVVLTVLFTQTI